MTSYHFTTPTTRADARWVPPFNYECSEGHRVEAEHAVTVCPAYHRGSPCSGSLTRVGKGSRSAS